MLEKTFQSLVSQDESLCLEFKSYWYWKDSKGKEEGWNELLKDVSAMFNTRKPTDYNERYIIFGYDEKTGAHNNYYEDLDGNTIDNLIDIDKIKEELIKKLKNRFSSYPEFKNSSDLQDIESIIEVKEIEYNDKKNLVFVFHNSPYLLMLNSNTGKGSRIGDILIRKIKEDNTPENIVADHSIITSLLDIIDKVKTDSYPENETTILKVVEAFRNKYLPDAESFIKANERNYTNGICFELYSIKSEYSKSISFIYFTKHTSQNKTFEYIKSKDLISKDEKIFVLLDRYNKKGGLIDISRLTDMFEGCFNDSKVYYIEDFSLTKLYEDLIKNDVFYKGQHLNKNFVKPYTVENSDKTADLLINEWYKSNNHPLLVLKGSGGCGKTTVVKNFIENLYKSSHQKNNVNILYINSHEIINDIMKTTKIEDIFDFYWILATKNQLSKKFSKELLALSSDNGNVVIVLDGIDEVIAKKGNDFNLSTLIESIFRDYSGNLNKTKIVMTCRDFFWDDSQSVRDVKTLQLKPFDEILARKYFSKNFLNDDKKVKQSMLIASKFNSNENKEEPALYIPYILDMIKENILSNENDVDVDLKTNILQFEHNVHDYLIAKSCEREIIKLDNLEIDEQLKIFNKIAIDYDGIFNEKHLENILADMHATKNLSKFKDHPLLIHDGGNLSFRYDFFVTYFKCLTLYSFLANDSFYNINESMTNLLIRHIGFENEFTSMLKARLGLKFSDKLKEIILFLVNDEYQISHLRDDQKSRLSSSLLILLLDICNSFDKNERTKLIEEVYEKDGYIDSLSIINLHSDTKNLVFDFRGLKFNNCFFENYDRFSECIFDDHTIFKNTTFKPILSRKNLTTNISNHNIDSSTCNIVGLDELLKNKTNLKAVKSDEARKNIKRIITYFWNNGYFTDKLEREAKGRFKNIYQTFEALVSTEVILTKKLATTQKRQDTLYYISPEYLDLRKIFEENDTCFEFELIVKNLEKFMKI